MTPTPEFFDANYNCLKLVPDFAGYFGRWRAQSAVARATLSPLLDLRYGPGPKETLDVFMPRTAAPGAPVLFFIHGGFWRSMDKADHSFIAAPFVERGAVVVIPNYDLCPDVAVADIAMEMARAMAFAWRNAATWGGDAARITLAGHSAGGHLAALLLACDGRKLGAGLPRQLARRALSISGLHELESIRSTPFLQSVLSISAADAVRLSPAWMAAPSGALLHAVVGGGESGEFLRQNQLIRDRWGAARVPVCEAIGQENHFSIVDRLVQPGHRLHELMHGLLQP